MLMLNAANLIFNMVMKPKHAPTTIYEHNIWASQNAKTSAFKYTNTRQTTFPRETLAKSKNNKNVCQHEEHAQHFKMGTTKRI